MVKSDTYLGVLRFTVFLDRGFTVESLSTKSNCKFSSPFWLRSLNKGTLRASARDQIFLLCLTFETRFSVQERNLFPNEAWVTEIYLISPLLITYNGTLIGILNWKSFINTHPTFSLLLNWSLWPSTINLFFI